MLGAQGLPGGLGDLGAFQQSLIGRLGLLFIDAYGLATALLTPEQFEGGAEVVAQSAPLLAVEIVHQAHQFGVLETVVSEELAHMRPVFLLAMGPARRDSCDRPGCG